MKFGYARVSSKDQNETRQIETLKAEGVSKTNIFIDKTSGKDKEREALNKLLNKVRHFDLVIVPSMDRLARSVVDLHTLLEEFNAKGATVQFIMEAQTYDPDAKKSSIEALLLGILGTVAEFERNLINERQAEGISAARQRGVYKGRKPSIDRDAIRTHLKAGLNKSQISRKMGISRVSVLRISRELEAEPA